jgi:hypothetical protein
MHPDLPSLTKMTMSLPLHVKLRLMPNTNPAMSISSNPAILKALMPLIDIIPAAFFPAYGYIAVIQALLNIHTA